MRASILLLLVVSLAPVSSSEPAGRTVTNLAYRAADEADAYARSRCVLDLHLPPAGATGFPCLVWFHGGGLEGGNRGDSRKWAASLAAEGLAVAVADYRLSPKASYPAYVRDAAAATAWTQAHIAEHGGDPRRVFAGGHSAGGYLAATIALDRRWLAEAGMDPNSLAGAIPVSGQMVTHYTVAKERGIPRETEVVDAAAPLAHARADAPPMLFFVGDRDMAGRADQNRRMLAALTNAGCSVARLLEIPDRDHNSIQNRMNDAGDPGRTEVLGFIRNTPPANPAAPPGGAADLKTGVFITHGEEARLEAYEKWLGRKVDPIMEFTPDDTWDHLVGTKPGLGMEWFLGIWEPAYRGRVVVSLPMLPADGRSSIEEGAKGAYDEHYRAVAAKLVKAGYGRSVIRLGWEFNAGWFKWSAVKNPGAWKQYWRRIVAAMRGVEGAAFRFNWCGTVGDNGMNPADAYPGDDVVDEIGCDIYDQSWHPNAYPYAAGDEAWKKPWRQDNAWKSLVEWGNYNLGWWARFAAEHDKPMTVPEWGLAGREDGHGGLDNPLFVRRMHAWLTDPKNRVTWHSYFEEDNKEIRSRLFDSPQYPEAAAEYRTLFGDGPAAGK